MVKYPEFDVSSTKDSPENKVPFDEKLSQEILQKATHFS